MKQEEWREPVSEYEVNVCVGKREVSDNIVMREGGCTVAGRTTHPRLHFTLVEDLNGMAKKQAEVEINKKKKVKRKKRRRKGEKASLLLLFPLTDTENTAFCVHALPLDRAQTLHHCRQPGGYPS